MSSSANRPATLSGISGILGTTLGEAPQLETAGLCGCSQSAISRRGDNLHQWPASDLLILAIRRPALADAIVSFLRGNLPQGEAIAASKSLLEEVEKSGELLALIARALKDGKVSPDEALDLLRAIRERRTFEDRELVPNLRACASTVMA